MNCAVGWCKKLGAAPSKYLEMTIAAMCQVTHLADLGSAVRQPTASRQAAAQAAAVQEGGKHA
jgi:hypothetical protein